MNFQEKQCLKTKDDIERIRESCRIASSVMKSVFSLDLDGMSTYDLDSIIEKQILDGKGRPSFKTVASYEFSSCISVNDEVVHTSPSKKKIIKNGDIVKVDLGVVKKGYFSDLCRTIPVGIVDSKTDVFYRCAEDAFYKAFSVCYPGKKLGDIGHEISSFVESRGFSVVKELTGHGLGFALHEPPVILHYGLPGTGEILRSGMVIAVEPIINMGSAEIVFSKNGWTARTSDGSLSAQYEDTIAITDHGPENLTSW